MAKTKTKIVCSNCKKDWHLIGDNLNPVCVYCVSGIPEKGETILEPLEAEARSLIGGDRRETYGPAKQSFANIADTWSAHLSQRGIIKEGTYLEGRDVAIMMAAFKLLRESAKPKRDNLVDAIGYILLAEQAT